MEKIFIGKVTEKTFDNGGSILKLSLSDEDKKKIPPHGYTTLLIKKSKKGTWYAEVDTFQPQVPQLKSSNDDLPF